MRWTPEARKKQSEAIKGWRPWDSSTGPRTAEGKVIASQNPFKHGARSRQYVEERRALNNVLKNLLMD